MEELDPDKLKGPGGLTLRQIHQQVKLSTARDDVDRTQNSSAPTVGWWRRFVRSIRNTKVKS
ncbi:hypothetical protein SAMN05216299_10332 [Nitrosospira sp. Nsp14]|uniref:hypothetical protein n=1 Tax=Nitrosospira sp. Nsp14 TaxID=1855333 RepID=UPI0008E69F94|nr:hypothetical protein [Nitrosospira sp. Nsp14]SFH21871.1 hypothetical protein SAMN05216299_10332 [Nitrosospira sp. Nsp14]